MVFYEILKVLQLRAKFRARYDWTRDRILGYRQSELAKMRAFAYTHSDFYKEFHKGLFNAPLNELPVLTKRMLMENWDQVVTDRSLKLEHVKRFIKNLKEPQLFNNQHYINSTSGSSGLKGLFAYNKQEWRNVLTSYARVYEWAGVNISLFRHYRVAVVSSLSPSHQSAVVGYTAKSRLMQTIRIDSTQPIQEINEQLNCFKPEVIIAYENMAKVLAQQQIAGELKIGPTIVICASEVLIHQARKVIKQAWNIDAYNTYGATETAGIASETWEHTGLRVFDDLVITENVDENNYPVPTGTFESKLLVTVLFSRTVPLKRYALEDSVSFAVNNDYSTLPFSNISGIQGRHEEILSFNSTEGKVAVQPNFFHNIFENLEINEWQIIFHNNTLEISLVKPVPIETLDLVDRMLAESLKNRGTVNIAVNMKQVEKLERTALGKTYLIKGIYT